MTVTPFSKDEYIPMCMCSGRDAILIGYDGSNFVSHNGHAHMETHQGAQTGWYKSAAKHAMDFMQPSIMAGIQVHTHGAAVVPTYYEQTFVPEEATLYTVLSFRSGLKLRISSFFTYDESVWCERFEVLEKPLDTDIDISFRVNKPFLSERLDFLRRAEAGFEKISDREIGVSYVTGDYTGRGMLIADKSFDNVRIGESVFADQCCAEGTYYKVEQGFTASRALILLDDSETHISFDELARRASAGFDALHLAHKSLWAEYFSTCSVNTGDEELDYLFKMSRYLAKSCQGVESGIVTLGMMPFHWRGAASCAWDEEMVHEAMLACGSYKESEHFTKQYLRQAPEGYRILKEKGLPGVAFTGWNSILGEFCGHRPIDEWLTTFKPMFAIYAVHTIYSEWRYNPEFRAEEYREIAIDVLKFLLSGLVKHGEDGLYYLTEVKDGMETGVMVKVDTSTTLKFAKGFLFVGEIYGLPEYTEIGEKMLLTLEGNRRPDGVLAAAKGSPYKSAVTSEYYESYHYGILDSSLLEGEIEENRTPFGYDSQVATEEKRHWPWYDGWALRDYIAAKMPKQAARHRERLTVCKSSLGALPEFVRLDGKRIGYYYTTPHGIMTTALAESYAMMRSRSELLLCYGFTKDTESFSCEGIVVSGGLKVSLNVKGGALINLRVQNPTSREAIISLNLNPDFTCPGLPSEIVIDSDGEYSYTNG